MDKRCFGPLEVQKTLMGRIYENHHGESPCDLGAKSPKSLSRLFSDALNLSILEIPDAQMLEFLIF